MKQTVKRILSPQRYFKLALLKEAAQRRICRITRAIHSPGRSFPCLPEKIYSKPDGHVFFGYYEVPQFSHNEKMLLATMAPLIRKTPGPQDSLRVGFFDLRQDVTEFREIGSTNTWCWQQGSRLQWYPYSGDQTVLYNTIVDGEYGCVIQNIYSGKIVKSLNRPIYAVSRDGKWGLSLDFSRLQRIRPGYGYNVLPDISTDDLAPAKDGIWRLDIQTGEEKLLFSVNDIVGVEPDETMDGAEHYFNHILFNPAGNRFMFFHIWQLADKQRNIRLFTCGINGNELRILNNSGYVSHYCWKDNNQLLAYATVSGSGTGYYLYDDISGKIQTFGEGLLSEDGHPSFLPDERHLITDTYPDKYGEQSLLLYDFKSHDLTVLDKEFSPVKFVGETRCDLHPRVSPSGKYISIDYIINGKRAIKVFDISSLIRKT